MASPWDQWDETNGGSLVAATVTTVTVAAIFVGLRFYTRMRIVHTLGPSDWAILLALVFSIGNTACTLHRTLLPLPLSLAHCPSPSQEFYFIDPLQSIEWKLPGC